MNFLIIQIIQRFFYKMINKKRVYFHKPTRLILKRANYLMKCPCAFRYYVENVLFFLINSGRVLLYILTDFSVNSSIFSKLS